MSEQIVINDEATFNKLLKVLVNSDKDTEVELGQAGALAGLARTEVFGLPIGRAAGALLAVGGWDALRGAVTGIAPTAPAWAIPAAGAWVMNTKIVRGWVGSEIANAAGLILLADAFQASMFNPRGWMSRLTAGFKLGGTSSPSLGSNGSKNFQTLEEYNKAMGRV